MKIFTPKSEVPFAGHPTLGTAYVIRRFFEANDSHNVVLSLKAGEIPVTFENCQGDGEIVWMKQLTPFFGRTFNFSIFRSLLGLEMKDFELKYPIQEVSKGLPL